MTGLSTRANPILLALLLAVCGMTACSKKQEGAQGKRPSGGAAVPVLVAQAAARDVPVEVQSIGNVQAFSSVTIRSRITGELFKVHIDEGQSVKAGDLLFTIDPRPSQGALNQMQATLKRDQAQLQSARLDFERIKKLVESNISSKDEYDKAEAAYAALQATVLADQAGVSNASLNLEFTQIRSPIDGRTGSLVVKEGNIVKAEDDRLVTINQVHPIYVAFSAPEQELAAIRKQNQAGKLAVSVNAPDSTNTLAVGQLAFIDNAVDPSTGTILLKGTFQNTNDVLWPGQFVQVHLRVDTLKQATVVPSQAVQSSQNGDFVFVVLPDSTVEKRSVTLGLAQQGFIVIESGLKPGETVVTDGQMKLAPKSKVSIQKSAEAPVSPEDVKPLDGGTA